MFLNVSYESVNYEVKIGNWELSPRKLYLFTMKMESSYFKEQQLNHGPVHNSNPRGSSM
jgi:hypothetical protein